MNFRRRLLAALLCALIVLFAPGAWAASLSGSWVLPNATQTGSLIASDGHSYSINASGQVTVDGTADSSTNSVAQIAYYNGQIYHQNTGLQWYSKTLITDSWTSAAAPVLNAVATSPDQSIALFGKRNILNKNDLMSFLNAIQGYGTLSGQYVGYGTQNNAITAFNNIKTNYGKTPAILGGSYWENADAQLTPNFSLFNPYAMTHGGAGGIVIVNLYTPQWSAGGSQDNVTVNGTTENTKFKQSLDGVAAGLKQLTDAGITPIVRPWIEMNGNWFWWGTGISDAQYKAMWQYAWNYIVTTKGVTQTVWDFTPNAGVGTVANRYPGSSYVDITGIDGYSSNISGYLSDYNYMLSNFPGKPTSFGEFGSGSPQNGDTSFDENTLINTISSTLPKMMMFQQWWDANAGGNGWGMASVQNAASALAQYRVINQDKVGNNMSGTLWDGNKNAYTITSTNQVMVNGVADTSTNQVTELAYAGGKVCQLNTLGDWYCRTNITDPWAGPQGTPLTGTAAGETLTVNTIGAVTSANTSSSQGATFTVTGTIVGLSAAPSLQYSDDGGSTWLPLSTGGGGRDVYKIPGGDGSAWIVPFGSGATWSAASDLDTIDIARGWNGSSYTAGPVGIINPVNNFGAVFWHGVANDNQYTFVSNNNGRSVAPDNGSQIQVKVHLPTGAYTPGPGNSDNPIVFVDPINAPNRQYTFGGVASLAYGGAGVQPGGGPYTGQSGEWDDITSDKYGEDADTGLSGYNVGAGEINYCDTDPACNPVYPEIPHAWRYSTDAHLLATNDNGDGATLKPDSWPQKYQDGQSGINVYSGHLKAGSTLGIPMSTAMPSGLNANCQGMFKTMQHRPGFFRDQAGNGLHLSLDQVAVSSQWGQDVSACLPQLVGLLRVLRNQHQTGQDFTSFPKNGPGTRVTTVYSTVAAGSGNSTVTSTTFSLTHPSLPAGSYQIKIRDANNTGVVATSNVFQVGTLALNAWQNLNLQVPGVSLYSGAGFHVNFVLPPGYNPANKYPLMIWEHPDNEGNDWYFNGGGRGSNNSDAQKLVNCCNEGNQFNSQAFQSAHPSIVALVYADQTCGDSAVCNFGGWTNNGSTGSATHFSGDTGPNVFAVLGLVTYMKANYSVDASQVLCQGFSLGGIGCSYMMDKYSLASGNGPFAGAVTSAGVLEINGYGNGPNTADKTAMRTAPIWAISGPNDGSSIPSHWNQPLWTALAGNSNYPTDFSSAANAQAGSTTFHYTQVPGTGHQDFDNNGNFYHTNVTVMNWLFGLGNNSGTGGTGGGTGGVVTPLAAGQPLPSGYLSVLGNQIQDSSGNNVRIASLGYSQAPQMGSYSTDMATIRSMAGPGLGPNAVRVPWYDAQNCPNGVCNFTKFDQIVTAAAANSMKVIFDHHGNEATNSCLGQQSNGIWFDSGPGTDGTDGCGATGTVTYARFKSNWVQFATHYNNNSTVIGFDLHNEPLTYGGRGLNWGVSGTNVDLRFMANDVGAAIHTANPGVLIIVEGPINNGPFTNGTAFSSGFTGVFQEVSSAGAKPVDAIPGKVVYSVHDYTCHLSAACPDSGTARTNMMNTAWGYLVSGNIAPVWIGEMGADLDNSDGHLAQDQAWASTVVSYINGGQGPAGGPTFSGLQQPVGTDWWLWGDETGQDPTGVCDSGSGCRTFKSGQQNQGWGLLLYQPKSSGTGGTTGGGGGGGGGGTGTGTGTTTLWNVADKSTPMSLDGTSKIATTTGTGNLSQSVRSTVGISTGKVCFAIVATNLTQNWDSGLASLSYDLNTGAGLGSDLNGIGFDPKQGPQGIFFNNAALSLGSGTSVSGEETTYCADLDAKLFWATSAAMRGAGNPWNNSSTANPATGTGGLSFAGMNCPCYVTFNAFEPGASATLNTAGPFAVTTPTGFLSWDTPIVTTTGAPLVIILGANDNRQMQHRKAG